MYIRAMGESYRSKRERWQRLLASLPEGLREHVSLRNVESVAALAPNSQASLLEAIRGGLKRLPRAVELLQANPDASAEDLLHPAVTPEVQVEPQPSLEIKEELASLLQLCFPDLPRVSAEALAEAEVMDVVRQTAQTHRLLFQSERLRADFVLLAAYGLLRQTLERLEEIIQQAPAVQQAFLQSGLPWKPNEWRN